MLLVSDVIWVCRKLEQYAVIYIQYIEYDAPQMFLNAIGF